MNLPFLFGRSFLATIPDHYLQLLAMGAAVVTALAFMWWVRHITGEPQYRSFRATTHGGSRLAVVAMGLMFTLVAALILIVPVIARMART